MVPNTAFGKAVKKALIDRDKSISWLCSQIELRTGMYADNGYLRKIFVGERKAGKMKGIICDILELPEEVRNGQD